MVYFTTLSQRNTQLHVPIWPSPMSKYTTKQAMQYTGQLLISLNHKTNRLVYIQNNKR